MIEITNGVMFLMLSMYGSANNTANIADAQSISSNSTVGNTPMVISTDRKVMEMYLKEHFADTPILVDIARCESEFRQFGKNGKVIRGMVDNADVGVMQINERYHLDTAVKLGYDIHTVEGNMAYAKYLYGKFGSEPWNASKPCWSKALAMK
jgi:hypothetical protein